MLRPQNSIRGKPINRLYIHVWIGDTSRVVGVIETSGEYWPPARRSSTFHYGRTWLESREAFPIDPINLPLVSGPQQAPAGSQLHGAFDDTCPDGWGQLVIEKRYPNDNFGKIEFIAATSDDRAGFLGYSTSPSILPTEMDAYGIPVSPEKYLGLADLLRAATLVDDGDNLPNELTPYFQRGSSIGGARPKASFVDQNGAMWIAKFSMRGDQHDNAKVEAACLDMAQAAGIETPGHHVQKIGDHSILLSRRFDRIIDDRGLTHRLGYLSAKTVLGADDLYRTNYCYADLASSARKLGSIAASEVFRRMIFNACIGNTDDHLKNTGYLRAADGRWRLSPVFDLVPYPSKRHMVMRLNKSHDVDIEDALSAHGAIGLRHDEAVLISRQIQSVTSRWRQFMRDRLVSDTDIEAIAPAFSSIGAPENYPWHRP